MTQILFYMKENILKKEKIIEEVYFYKHQLFLYNNKSKAVNSKKHNNRASLNLSESVKNSFKSWNKNKINKRLNKTKLMAIKDLIGALENYK